jgi:hypothetical protein
MTIIKLELIKLKRKNQTTGKSIFKNRQDIIGNYYSALSIMDSVIRGNV